MNRDTDKYRLSLDQMFASSLLFKMCLLERLLGLKDRIDICPGLCTRPFF